MNYVDFANFAPSLRASLPDCIESQAICFFVTECVLVPQQLHMEHNLVKKVLIPLYVEAAANSALVSIMSALSLRAFSQKAKRQSLLLESEKHYGHAVSRLNQALASPSESQSDATLLSVLMLLIRETTSMTESSTQTWRQHVRGAIELVKLRGRDSFKGYTGRRLFLAVREQCLGIHLAYAKSIPEEEIEGLWKTQHLQSVYSPGDALAELALHLPGMRERALNMFHLPLSNTIVQETIDLMASVRQLDANIAAWRFTVDTSWEFKTIHKHSLEPHEDPISSTIWPGDVHTYRNLWVTMGWNSYRVLRIICQTLMMNCLERLLPAEKLLLHDEFLKSTHVIQRLANEICSTIPFMNRIGPDGESSDLWHSDWKIATDKSSSDDSSAPRFRPETEKHQPLCLNIGGLGIVWHLNVVSTLYQIPRVQREWARQQMYMLGRTRGMDQARVMRAMGDSRVNEAGRMYCVTDMVPTPFEPMNVEDSFENLLIDPTLR